MESNHYTTNYIIHKNGDIESLMSHKILKPTVTKNGYQQVTLYDTNGNHKKFLVHRLVAQEHISNPTNLPQVNHKDMNKANNNANNLEWCDAKYNLRHARTNGANIYTKERNHKISIAKKGVPCPQQTREKLSEYWSGKMGGKNNHMFGKHLSPESIQKRTHSRFHKSGPVPGCKFCLLNSDSIASVD